MLILHLSDLHFGKGSRFADWDLHLLGEQFYQAVAQEQERLGIAGKVDLVALSGDIAETAREEEYVDATQFLTALSGELGLDNRRFVFVPGNHDVNWINCERVILDQKERDLGRRSYDNGWMR